ncbi:COR domain-containing protein [Candidatus Poribacteria bacterium]
MDKRELREKIEEAKHKQTGSLDLSGNELTELPSEIGQLTSLTRLDLRSNKLTELPPEIGQLTSLTSLFLSNNELTELPPEIGQLTSLLSLFLRNNQLTELPPEIGQLTELMSLHLINNKLTELPPEIGQLTLSTSLELDENPLISPPPDVVKQGTKAILTYLQGQMESSRRQWVSKLLVVGEGGVGKTCLLRALQGEPFDPESETTHGVKIELLGLEHPTEADVTMQLNCWDFGGQQIYHATHQFFLTSRSLFLLVWDTRSGYRKSKLYEWMDTIQARAPESPVLIVAAHIDERDADLPLGELQKQYSQIVGHCKVSNKTGEGVEELREAITGIAAKLPLMGQNWPAHWLDAADAIRSREEEKYISPAEFWKVMSDNGVSDHRAEILARSLHELGDILYFRDDDELNDLVIIKPQWVTEYISKVLESEEVIDQLGIFRRDHMYELWGDLDLVMQDHFLRLMERFDLSYRTLDNREISLVVERLPLDPPEDYEELWDSIKDAGNRREIAMRFRLNTIPAGIPTWFIARAHRFTTHTHWRNGALFAYDKELKHLALAQADEHKRYVQLTVRGPNPHNFFSLLKDGIEVTLERFPGLEIERMIPCPGPDGEPCGYEFNYAHLEKAIERNPPVEKVTCMVCFEEIPVSDLLFGIHWSTQNNVLKQMEAANAERHKQLLTLLQREFTSIYKREQSQVDSYCPNVFALRPRSASRWRKIAGQTVELQLYCQNPGEWHPCGKPYTIKVPAVWIRTVAPYLQKMVGVMKYAAPLAAPVVGAAASGFASEIENDLKLMEELVKKLPDLKEAREVGLAEMVGEVRDLERVGGAPLRAIRQLLEDLDPQQSWGGLRRILTPEGHYLWLCEEHAKEYLL